jgi:hypothetical protein
MATTLQNLENTIEDLKADISDLKKSISGLQIDLQNTVTKNKKILPGIGTKIGYDSNGLVTSSMELEVSDLPTISISKVTGLRDELDSYVTSDYLDKKLKNLTTTIDKSTPVATGIKVNYDKNGLIVSSSDELLSEDIPQLSIDKITGLTDRLSNIESLLNETTTEDTKSNTIFNAGEYTKITIDANGNIVKGSKLSINDIPIDIITRLNELELSIGSCVNQDVITTLSSKVINKLDANDPIISGTYTKVSVDQNGLITNGSSLEYEDLPDRLINEIDSIKSQQEDMVTGTKLVDIVNQINERLSIIDTLFTTYDEQISNKATNEDLTSYKMDMIHLEDLVNELNEKIPNDTIMEQLNLITKNLSNLDGRISVIENKLNITSDI